MKSHKPTHIHTHTSMQATSCAQTPMPPTSCAISHCLRADGLLGTSAQCLLLYTVVRCYMCLLQCACQVCVCLCVCVSVCEHAVKLWARLDDLRVDNENTVAVLISHWWLHNHPTAVRSPVTTPRIGGTGSGSGQAPSMTQQGTQTSSSPGA